MFYFAYLENSYPELERFFCIHLSPSYSVDWGEVEEAEYVLNGAQMDYQLYKLIISN